MKHATTEMEIIAYYERCNSMKQTSKHFNVSMGTVRKILLAHGLYTSDRAQEIQTLIDAGNNMQEISTLTGLSKSAIDTYIPYKRGTYLEPSTTPNAARLRKYREKKQKSLDKLNNT